MSAVHVGVGVVVRVPRGAMGPAGVLRHEADRTPQDVLTVRHRLEMSRVDASTCSAPMVECHPPGDRAYKKRVESSMSKLTETALLDLGPAALPVAIAGTSPDGAGPKPAAVGLLLYAAHHASDEGVHQLAASVGSREPMRSARSTPRAFARAWTVSQRGALPYSSMLETVPAATPAFSARVARDQPFASRAVRRARPRVDCARACICTRV